MSIRSRMVLAAVWILSLFAVAPRQAHRSARKCGSSRAKELAPTIGEFSWRILAGSGCR
jgi:hypothetical protein